jgi:hypothetical protein
MPDIAGDHLEENDMRNVLVSALMISLYALSSTMDFVDAERLRASHKQANASAMKERLALSNSNPVF